MWPGDRGTGGKTIVFGIFKREGCVFTEIVPDASKQSLLKAIRGRVDLGGVIHTDGWRGYDGLVDVGYAKRLRVNPGVNEFAHTRSPRNGIESFWAYAKHRLAKFKGVPKHTFYLHMKESEFVSTTDVITYTPCCSDFEEPTPSNAP